MVATVNSLRPRSVEIPIVQVDSRSPASSVYLSREYVNSVTNYCFRLDHWPRHHMHSRPATLDPGLVTSPAKPYAIIGVLSCRSHK